jgi:MFS family permease
MTRDLILIAVSMCLWGIGEGMFYYFQPIYLQQMGADPIKIGAILGAAGIIMTVSHLPAGYLADRFGRKPVMVSAWLLGMVSTWLMALANSLTTFVIGLLCYGSTLYVISPLNSYVTIARGKWSVGRVITLVSATFNLGMIVGPWLGGQIGARMGLRQTYYIAAWVFVLSTFVILFIRPQPTERPTAEKHNDGWLFNPRYLSYLGIIFLAAFALYLPQPLSPNYLQNQRGLDVSQIGPLYSITSLGVVVLNLTLGQLPARVGFVLGQLAVGLFSLLLWKGSGLPVYILGFFLLGGFKTVRSLAVAQVRDLVPQGRIGLAYGLTETIGTTSTILAPPLAGYLYTHNPSWIYALGTALIAISIPLSYFFSPAPHRTPMAPELSTPAHSLNPIHATLELTQSPEDQET